MSLKTKLPAYLVSFTEKIFNVKLHFLWLKHIASNHEEQQSIANVIKIDNNIKKSFIQKY